jgi:hypothetical protein
MRSLEGIYIANKIDPKIMEEHKQEINEEMIQNNENLGDQDQHHQKIHNHATKDIANFVETVITFNKGGKWTPLTAPERDSSGKKYDCGENCYLHLHGVNSKYPQFYSVEKAVGIILGNGNVGKYLSQNEEDLSTFLSRDGGLSWFEVHNNLI